MPSDGKSDQSTFATELPLRLKILRWIGHQKWMTYGQDFLLRMLYDPDSEKHFNFEVDFFGLRYRGDLAHFLDWVVFCYGAAPMNELILLRDLAVYLKAARSIIAFFDVGANVGHHSLFMSPIADRIISFEPIAGLRELIVKKIALNHLGNVEIVPFALGLSDQELDFYPSLTVNSGTGSFIQRSDWHDGKSIKLPVRNGDKLFERLSLPRIDLMKIDVEGFEPFVLQGLAHRIRDDRPAILMEMSDQGRNGFGSENGLRSLLYDDAVIADVTGRAGREYKLVDFDYATSREAVIVPPEMADFINSRMHRRGFQKEPLRR